MTRRRLGITALIIAGIIGGIACGGKQGDTTGGIDNEPPTHAIKSCVLDIYKPITSHHIYGKISIRAKTTSKCGKPPSHQVVHVRLYFRPDNHTPWLLVEESDPLDPLCEKVAASMIPGHPYECTIYHPHCIVGYWRTTAWVVFDTDDGEWTASPRDNIARIRSCK